MFRLEMEYCHQAGISHSEFLSWDAHDQDAEISYMLESKSRCPQCGTHPSEWLDEEGRHLEPMPYVVQTIACLGCELLAEARDQIPDKRRRDVHVFLVPNEEVKRGWYNSDRRQGSSRR